VTIKEEEAGGACITHRRCEKYIHNFDWKPRRKESLGRPKRRWEDNIKINRIGTRVWSGLNRLRIETSGGFFVNTIMNLRVP
jgi:hypothetical protein